MKLLVLIRHGQSLSNVRKILSDDIDGFPLTENGIRQVEETAAVLSRFRFDGLWSSPVLRARQTAEIISRAIEVPVETVDDLRETEMGIFNGMNSEEALMALESGHSYESWKSHLRRLQRVMDAVDGKIICVSHAMPITVMVASMLSMNQEESRGIDISNSSITVLDLEGRKILSIGSRRLSPRIEGILGSH